jgi:ATP-binding cassette subfamily B protein
MKNQEIKTLLKEVSLFSILSGEELEHFAGRVEIAHYTLGQPICRAGDQSDALFIVYSGRARVISENTHGQEVTLGTLTRGDFFGEQGLFDEAKIDYSVRAAEDLALLRLGRHEVGRLLASHPNLRNYFDQYANETSIRYFLRRCSIFAPLTPAELRGLLGCLQERKLGAGEFIYREGERGDALYILRTGSVRVVQENLKGKVISHLKPGDAFGLTSLLTGQSRGTSAVTTEASTVFRIEKAEFDRLLMASPALKDAMVSIAAGYGETGVRMTAPLPPPPTGRFRAPMTAPLALAPAPVTAEAAYHPRRARRYPALMQISETDCGAACLAMILRYYRKHVSLNRLRDPANVSRDGASLHSISEAAEALGFHGRGIHASWDHLKKVEYPAVAHWEGFHYVVVYEVDGDRVVIADPAIGLRRLSREEFTKGWTGYLLLLTPTPRLEGVEESRTTIGRFLPLLKPYRKFLLEIFLASLVLQIFGLASPIFTQVIVDQALVHKSLPMLNMMLIGMLLVALFQAATEALRYYLLVHTTRRIDMQMVVDFYRHVLSLPMRYFEERKVGDILKRFNENERIREFLTGRSLGVALDCMMIFVYLGLMFFYNTKLSLLALLFIPGYIGLTVGATPVLKRQNREVFERAAEADSQMVESVTGIGAVKATASERVIRWKLEGLLVKAMNIRFRNALTGMAVSSFGNVLHTLNTALLFWFGAHLVISGELTVGQLVAFNVLVGNVNRPILSLIDLWREVQEISVSLERLNDVFDSKPEEDIAKPALMRIPPVRGHIRFEQVTFRYPSRGDRNALENVNLEIYAGQTVALVGRSGAGKSTFANLLLRMHEPNAGRIFVDGYDLRQVSINSLRSQVGVVPQDVFLFSGTIRENVAFGDPDARLQEVVGAAMLAGAHEFISELPLGYETKIGERGQSLSGGQKQRIAIARALFKKPSILIFDEATSALDTESERAIQQNLDKILKDRTTIIIAHRLSTVRNADLIVVLDRGIVLETGNHYSLMEQRGLYYYLNSQQLES